MAALSPSSSLSQNSLIAYEAAMRRRFRTTFLFISSAAFLFLFLHLHLRLSPLIVIVDSPPSDVDLDLDVANSLGLSSHIRHLTLPGDNNLRAVAEPEPEPEPSRGGADSVVPAPALKNEETVAILFPDWQVFVDADPSSFRPDDELHCVFQNNDTSPASFSGVLPFSNRTVFLCVLPNRVRRLRPFYQPILTRSPLGGYPLRPDHPPPELFRTNHLAYQSLSTEDDVVLFVKGVNNKQGVNRPPSEFKCVFYFSGDDPATAGVRTPVTSSGQEVFRCRHPDLTPLAGEEVEPKRRTKVSLEIPDENKIIPSVTYYSPQSASVSRAPKSHLCACTMVYNVAKVLREWVTYNSRIGVERVVLYDNGSDDDLNVVVEELNREGYDVRTIFWPWPKTQEAGFSHSAVYHNDSCTWMMYVDVDEFVYSPTWLNRSQPSDQLIRQTFLPRPSRDQIGQISINCNEFGPSGQTSHPPAGVTQGYTCRRRLEQRHKSILRLDAVHPSLLNAIHHFTLRDGFHSKQLGLDRAVVNHYKYQAWPEFQTKFRRRVSAYVVDWKEAVNPASKDRTPGLGFEPKEPKNWANMFCEVTDLRLKMFVQRWFGTRARSDYRMPWAAR